jgi:hypothetical protein
MLTDSEYSSLKYSSKRTHIEAKCIVSNIIVLYETHKHIALSGGE